ncbi:LON peptidase substrate-binding domain-containing protein [Aeromicrobium wangtongii]|uniref:LON peptidase substrate-binding domain-containing protein n=1 Tax=Aeromicrobium wangtongii TaxID=2969247 RepID=UPI002017C8D4|nr:LON peptidase substrate-binding domain-containing protein [Aeromicrobium wangtongii]MCL3817052.1 LON peptidase substrate-binding domain-containing protein [Aeromicrobium wangtongii]
MDELADIPMFPLGSVLFPAMPLALRVFEPRYLQLLQDVMPDGASEFGVVLIERGQEVGGGEKRFDIGTICQIADVKVADGYLAVLGEGTRRIEVVEWLAEDPYPRARVRELAPLVWDESLLSRREQTEALVRRTLLQASEFEDQAWSASVQLSEDPVESLWQLAAVAPLGPLDQLRLLRCATPRELLDAIFIATQDAGEIYDARGTQGP